MMIDRLVFGFDNKLLLGADVNSTYFIRDRGFPSASIADYVDAWNPNQSYWGVYPGEWPIRRSPTRIDNYAALFEDVLALCSDLKLVTGARYEFERLDRVNYNQNGTFSNTTSFRRNFHPFNFRVGNLRCDQGDLALWSIYDSEGPDRLCDLCRQRDPELESEQLAPI
ncbi:hypothetical protein [Methylocapsa aurea]|uniref:hypothetical protein n=1 Tax=Methylocapsa aurea TaxID=663610 RepID=UPI003D18EAFF